MAVNSKIEKNDLGLFIKETREKKGITLIQLAAKAGCSTSSINMSENKLRNLRSDTAIRVLSALGINKKETEKLMKGFGYDIVKSGKK